MTTEQYLREIRDNGFTIFEQVIPPNKVDAIRQSVLEVAERECNPQIKADVGVTHVSMYINHNQSFVPYLVERRMTKVIGALFGPHFRVSFTSSQINDPGNPRTAWHADWPFNQRNAGHIPVPYPDFCMHLTSLWMFSPFTRENGGTLVVPGSHRINTNPTTDMGVDANEPYPTELLVTGEAGSVLMFDSRLWHAANHNGSSQSRVSMAIRFAPWWLNLDVLLVGSEERQRMVDETGDRENALSPVSSDVFNNLPDEAKPLFRHWVAQDESQPA